jgi:hypothetical protein
VFFDPDDPAERLALGKERCSVERTSAGPILVTP